MTQASLANLPPGLTEPLDLNIAEASFPDVGRLVSRFPDICWVPTTRKADSCLINHPDLIKRVLIDNHRNYLKGHGIERVKMLLGNGIIVSDGETWKRQRRMVQPAFHRDILRELSGMMRDKTGVLLRDLQQKAEAGATLDLGETMSRYALDIILRCLFSDDLDRMCNERGGNPFSIFTDHSERDLNLAVRFRAVMASMRGVIDARRRAGGEQPADMLAVLMASRDLQGRPMDDKALIDELMTLIVAGHETSAITLTWMWYRLGRHPEVERRLHAEVDALAGKPGDAPDYDSAGSLVYCKQVMSETLRLYPPVWLFTRRAIQADRFGDFEIPAGTDIFISPYFLHRRADIWPEPEHFDPERFADAAVEARHRTAYIPFSAGPRKCIGDVLSILEMQIHMGTLARLVQMRPVDDAEPELEPAINLRNKRPIRMTVQLRR